MSASPWRLPAGEWLEPPPERVNVSRRLRHWAGEAPERVAVRAADGTRATFAELERRCDAIARGLLATGLRPGDRASLFVRPGVELIAITHALLRTGVVPVLIDPGMGRRSLLACIERMAPRAVIGVPRIHVARRLFPGPFERSEIFVTVGSRRAWGGVPLERLEQEGPPLEIRDSHRDETAAILFTSGSTGPPKGVVYTHGTFEAQLAALRHLYDLRPGEVDAACFPLFALFDNALGMTSVFPDLDPSHPGTCDPRRIHRAIEASKATFTFGSPAIWRRVVPWARAAGERFTTLRRVTIAGAPVPPRVVAGLREILPKGADVHTPYGATEALPVSSLSGFELATGLHERVEGGEGTCVGRPAPGIEVRVVRIEDGPLERWDDSLEVPRGIPGEICVRGAVVTRAYEGDEEATRAAKIPDGDTLWHRMGDVGYVDDEGRLWFLGRKDHRLETERGLLMPVPVENVFNRLPAVHRTALVGVGRRGAERPHLVVELERGASRRSAAAELEVERERLATRFPIEGILFRRAFPVDVRHNAKIHRLELKRWAEGRVRP